MSGHSKWATIKHKKAALDAKKGAAFTRLAREVSVAAREGGSGDVNMNFRLRLAVDKARAANMPGENVERAIKKGLGVSDSGARFEEIAYEGYGPGGAAILVKAMTDNRNRTASEVRAAFTRGGGNLGETGSVGWVFDSKAIVTVDDVDEAKAEEVALAAIDAGADDFKVEDGSLEIIGPPASLEAITKIVKAAGLEASNATIGMVPKTTLALDGGSAVQTLRLMDRLEELDDVQQVFTNADFAKEALEEYGAA
ncbi:MAG: YebC/PmpR family DNA-binding transcriptional regulator [SAR202 cluster bacterium]|nr:YebC/PmpR family DNA-binding transcriptional regulator [SAR202 cluster bacterium]